MLFVVIDSSSTDMSLSRVSKQWIHTSNLISFHLMKSVLRSTKTEIEILKAESGKECNYSVRVDGRTIFIYLSSHLPFFSTSFFILHEHGLRDNVLSS